jgi:hypothetical protein
VERRFDRELGFPLPNKAAREAILDIHTKRWAAPPSPHLREELAHACVGFCGADLKVPYPQRPFLDFHTSFHFHTPSPDGHTMEFCSRWGLLVCYSMTKLKVRVECVRA